MSLDDLAQRIANGDRQAENELVETLGRGTFILLRRLAGDPELAKDLYQETFRIVLISLREGKLENADRIAAFVRGTAKNLLRSEWRKKTRRGHHEDVEDVSLVDPRPNQHDRAQVAEDGQRVLKLLEEMSSDRDRQVLYRHYLEEQSKQRICDDLGIEASQFNVILFRARQRFKRLVGAKTGEENRRGFELVHGGGPKDGSAGDADV